MTFLVEGFGEGAWQNVCETHSTYYAISIPRLLELMEAAGFVSCGRSDSSFFQPVLTGRVAG